MKKVADDLYSNVPPTRIRHRYEVFREPQNNPFWHMIADYVFGKMIKNRFFSTMVKNWENFDERDKKYATIYYAPHTNWWDGSFHYILMRKLLHVKKFRIMIEEMNRFPLFKYVGAYPVNKKTPQTAMQALKYTYEHVLNDKDCAFLIFPQGIIRPPFHRPEKFDSGLAYMIEKAVKLYGGINIIPVATTYCFLRQDRPEILVEYGKVKTITSENINPDRRELTRELEKEFQELCDKQKDDIGNANFEGYYYFYKNKLHWWKSIEYKLKSVGMKKAMLLEKGNEQNEKISDSNLP